MFCCCCFCDYLKKPRVVFILKFDHILRNVLVEFIQDDGFIFTSVNSIERLKEAHVNDMQQQLVAF